MAAEKYSGLQYPMVKGPHGLAAKKSGVEQVKADVLQLLLTNPGERVMLPTFGTPLRKLVFEPNDTILEEEAKRLIGDALRTWEPRVVVTQLLVSSVANLEGMSEDDTGDEIDRILGIKIEFIDPDDISQIEALHIELPLGQ